MLALGAAILVHPASTHAFERLDAGRDMQFELLQIANEPLAKAAPTHAERPWNRSNAGLALAEVLAAESRYRDQYARS